MVTMGRVVCVVTYNYDVMEIASLGELLLSHLHHH